MHPVTFTTIATPGRAAAQALLLARSLRRNGGAVAAAPLWVMVPDGGARPSRGLVRAFEDLDARLVPFGSDPVLREIPFAVKAAAGAAAEALASSERLAWLDPDTVVVGDASEFLIRGGAAAGYRPVHHRLIGMGADDPVEGFWAAVFDACGTPHDRTFPMHTNVGERIRAYVNAGVFVVRPERSLLRRWLEALVHAVGEPEVAASLRGDGRRPVFLHQAVWTAVLLRDLERSEMTEMSPAVNYPMNLHHEIPAGRRALSLDRLVAVRTEDLLFDPEWAVRLPILAPLAGLIGDGPLCEAR